MKRAGLASVRGILPLASPPKLPSPTTHHRQHATQHPPAHAQSQKAIFTAMREQRCGFRKYPVMGGAAMVQKRLPPSTSHFLPPPPTPVFGGDNNTLRPLSSFISCSNVLSRVWPSLVWPVTDPPPLRLLRRPPPQFSNDGDGTAFPRHASTKLQAAVASTVSAASLATSASTPPLAHHRSTPTPPHCLQTCRCGQ